MKVGGVGSTQAGFPGEFARCVSTTETLLAGRQVQWRRRNAALAILLPESWRGRVHCGVLYVQGEPGGAGAEERRKLSFFPALFAHGVTFDCPMGLFLS